MKLRRTEIRDSRGDLMKRSCLLTWTVDLSIIISKMKMLIKVLIKN
jgi:hypothetical protein